MRRTNFGIGRARIPTSLLASVKAWRTSSLVSWKNRRRSRTCIGGGALCIELSCLSFSKKQTSRNKRWDNSPTDTSSQNTLILGRHHSTAVQGPPRPPKAVVPGDPTSKKSRFRELGNVRTSVRRCQSPRGGKRGSWRTARVRLQGPQKRRAAWRGLYDPDIRPFAAGLGRTGQSPPS